MQLLSDRPAPCGLRDLSDPHNIFFGHCLMFSCLFITFLFLHHITYGSTMVSTIAAIKTSIIIDTIRLNLLS